MLLAEPEYHPGGENFILIDSNQICTPVTVFGFYCQPNLYTRDRIWILLCSIFVFIIIIPYLYSFHVPYHQLKKHWRGYAEVVSDLCEPDFWKVFDTVRHQSGTCVWKRLTPSWNNTLVWCWCYLHDVGHRWPSSNRSLRNRVTKLGDFWDAVSSCTHNRPPETLTLPFD